MSALHLHTRTHGGGCTVEVIGPITRLTTADLRNEIRRVLKNGQAAATIELDLRCCTDVDIDGLLTLDVAYHAASRRGGRLRLIRVPPLIERLVRQHNLSHLIDGEATTRLHATSVTDFEVPEADALEQQIPADPQADTAAQDGTRPELVVTEADPADVEEQHQEVPLDDDGDDNSPTRWQTADTTR